eukprot:18956-Heterococcus_DN1.PRE.4
MDGYIEKQGPAMSSQRLADLACVYDAVSGKSCIIQCVSAPQNKESSYTTALRPIGIEMTSAPLCTVQNNCVWQSVNYGHGDVRWPNVIELPWAVGIERFMLIDLENVVTKAKLGSHKDVEAPFNFTSWKNGAVLKYGVYNQCSV